MSVFEVHSSLNLSRKYIINLFVFMLVHNKTVATVEWKWTSLTVTEFWRDLIWFLITFATFEFCNIAANASKVFRSSHPKIFCKRDVLKDFTKLIGIKRCWRLFFDKVAGFTLQFYQKRVSKTGVFLRTFKKNLRTSFLYRALPVGAS